MYKQLYHNTYFLYYINVKHLFKLIIYMVNVVHQIYVEFHQKYLNRKYILNSLKYKF